MSYELWSVSFEGHCKNCTIALVLPYSSTIMFVVFLNIQYSPVKHDKNIFWYIFLFSLLFTILSRFISDIRAISMHLVIISDHRGHRWAALLERTRTFFPKGFSKAASRRVKDFPYKISLTIGFHSATSSSYLPCDGIMASITLVPKEISWNKLSMALTLSVYQNDRQQDEPTESVMNKGLQMSVWSSM